MSWLLASGGQSIGASLSHISVQNMTLPIPRGEDNSGASRSEAPWTLRSVSPSSEFSNQKVVWGTPQICTCPQKSAWSCGEAVFSDLALGPIYHESQFLNFIDEEYEVQRGFLTYSETAGT